MHKIFFLIVLGMSILFLMQGELVSAADMDCPSGFTLKAGTCFPDSATVGGLSDVSVFALITRILNWVLGILGILGVLAFVISGTQYLLSAGDEKLAETGKKNMTYAIIGLVIALSGLIIVNAVAFLTGAGA